MSDLAKFIKLDSVKIEEGIWVDYIGDIRLKIRSLNSQIYKRRRQELIELFRLEMRTADQRRMEEINEEIRHKLTGDVVLIGWENIQDEEKEVVYSSDNAYTLVKKYPLLFNYVEAVAGDIDPYRPTRDPDAPKN